MPSKLIRKPIPDYTDDPIVEPKKEQPRQQPKEPPKAQPKKGLKLYEKKVLAKMDEYFQVLPDELDDLNAALNDQIEKVGLAFYRPDTYHKACSDMDGFKKISNAITNDGYNWRFGLFFEFDEDTPDRTKIAVLFPKVSDHKKKEGTMMARSVGVYIKGLEWRKYSSKVLKDLTKRVKDIDMYAEYDVD